MSTYLVRRTLMALVVLFGVTIINFFIINLAPGNPVDLFVDPFASQADIDIKKENLGLNDPLWVQYFRWLQNLLQGNFGFSYSTYEPVLNMVASRIGPTLLLMGSALLVSYIIAIPVGIISAVKQYSPLDYASTTFSLLGSSIPTFFLGLGAIYVFAVVLQVVPTGGMQGLGADGGTAGDIFKHMILPVLVLGTANAGNLMRYVRTSMLEVLSKDYLRTARAKGLKEFVVTNKHALRNALIPIVTIMGMDIPFLIGGAVVTEQVFQWPGLGQLTIQSINSRDYPTIMAINFIAAVAVILSNILTDIVYTFVDPRIRYR